MTETTDAIRASDREREHAAARLRDHAATGRLSIEELTTRVDAALTARTRTELEALFADLPAAASPAPPRRDRVGARIHTRIYVLVCLAMIAIWGASGMGYFWPMWPIFGWGMGVFSHRSGCRGKSRQNGAGTHRPRSPSLPQA